jgi:hypothetical protein
MLEGHRPTEWRFWVSMDPWLDRLAGHGPAEWRSWVCVSLAWQALGAQACGVNIVQGCVGLGGMAQWDGDRVGLYLQCGRPWGHVPAEQRSCRAGGHSPKKQSSCRAVPTLRVWPSQMEIVRVCISGMAGLGAWPGRAEKGRFLKRRKFTFTRARWLKVLCLALCKGIGVGPPQSFL